MSKVILKYICFVVIDLFCMLFLWIPGALLAGAFAKSKLNEDGVTYDWGIFSLWGTFDNPVEGDDRWIRQGSYWPGVTKGFKGYVNRVGWLLRNPMYGLAVKLSLWWKDGYRKELTGNPHISDKYGIPGSYTVKLYDGKNKIIGFEYYAVKPWSKGRCLRIRVGWKIDSSKVEEIGIMQFVFTCNPFDGYDNN